MLLKIFGLGFIFDKGAYLRDYWNFMDIIIVITSWIPIIVGVEGSNFTVFRTLRILRPLRTIKNIRSLRRIIVAIV